MYRLKPKKGYNVVLNDLGIILKDNNYCDITDEQYEQSKDLVASLKFLDIKKDPVTKKEKEKTKENKKIVNENDVFLINGRSYENPKDSFVLTQEDIIKKEEDQTITKPVIEKDTKIEKEVITKEDTKIEKETSSDEVKEKVEKPVKKSTSKNKK